MKFVRFASAAHPDGVYGIVGPAGIEVISGGLFDTVEKSGEIVKEGYITEYLPPIDPPNIIAIGLNYVDHASESSSKLPEQPLFFMKPSTSVTGHLCDVMLPKMAPTQVDYEAEMCIIIGKTARHISREEAADHIFGYTCGMDISARDCQFGDGQWIRGKGFDTFAPLGPYVTTDFDPSNSRVSMRLNGQTMQDEPTSSMVFDVPTLVSYLSQWATLRPGTVILTGTPSGVGFARTPPVYLREGDICECDIEGLGVLKVNIVAECI